MPLTELEQVARIFSAFATGLAVLIGTVWAIVRFMSPREVAQARVALELREQELQPVVDLTMRADRVAPVADGSWMVVATVVASNQGKKTARLAYDEGPPLGVYRIDQPADGTLGFALVATEPVRQAADPTASAPASIVRPGQTQEIPFRVGLASPGWYFFAFRAVLSEDDRQALEQAGVPRSRLVSWTAKMYLEIPDASSAS